MKRWAGYEHGINLGGWLSQCDNTEERYAGFIKEEDIARISSWGTDHVRVPVDYNLVEDEQGVYKESGFAHIQDAIDWCRKYHLNMVLDLHKTYGYSFDAGEGESGFFDNEDYQERFYRLWEEFAKRFAKNEDMLAFELLNEVTEKSFCDAWNRISDTCIKKVRAIAPTIKILIGGYYNNSIEALKDLLPPQDENIVYNFHCYEPLIFTHQGAYWIDTMDVNFRIPMSSTYGEMAKASCEMLSPDYINFADFPKDDLFGVEYFEYYFGEAVRVAEERNVPLYCGEYGVINLASPEDTLKWYQIIHAAFEKFGIGRAAWSYKEMDYGFVDAHMDPVRDEVLKYI